MGPPDTWNRMRTWLESIDGSLPARPKALLVVSAHWEEDKPTVLVSPAPPLLFDYSGFPPHTYELKWPAQGAPELAERVRGLLGEAGIQSGTDGERGFDHGVFVPMLVAYPDARIPTLQLSLRKGLDPAEHLAIGRALAPLRDEGVLIIGSGMSYHNMRGFNSPRSKESSVAFDDWLRTTVALPAPERDAALTKWTTAPMARQVHPREEHLLPLMVAAGAAGQDPGKQVFRDEVMSVVVSATQFG
jgi:aromatic ring-opening dioxygenase catalytic subunit (LigB family)